MSRKDTILIAVIVNAGLLAILLATAIIYDPDKSLDQSDMNSALAAVKTTLPSNNSPIAIAGPSHDEVDNVLSSYTYRATEPNTTPDFFINEPLVTLPPLEQVEVQELITPPLVMAHTDGYVEVTVKKGDVLEKIAKANGTTVSAIKKLNHLQNERLQIGQVLKVPVNVKQEKIAIAAPSAPAKKKELEAVDSQYYVIKNGDNPWKIAKQFNLKFDDILRLNNLDEESAKNLKPGDRIRIK